jgi:hypothetical protein
VLLVLPLTGFMFVLSFTYLFPQLPAVIDWSFVFPVASPFPIYPNIFDSSMWHDLATIWQIAAVSPFLFCYAETLFYSMCWLSFWVHMRQFICSYPHFLLVMCNNPAGDLSISLVTHIHSLHPLQQVKLLLFPSRSIVSSLASLGTTAHT